MICVITVFFIAFTPFPSIISDRKDELNEDIDYLYVSNRTFESIVPLARQNGLTVFHGQNISGISGLDENNDVVIEIYRYPGDFYTHKVIVYDFRSEKILTISCLNNYWFGWKSFNFTDIS